MTVAVRSRPPLMDQRLPKMGSAHDQPEQFPRANQPLTENLIEPIDGNDEKRSDKMYAFFSEKGVLGALLLITTIIFLSVVLSGEPDPDDQMMQNQMPLGRDKSDSGKASLNVG
eukprot:CAMPEP_0195522684 /NCGR_PEP_ID=MMETSP0794_2-20130614/21097_1 /TAXON_ID=515487 /ORGANISM="Stephanopyxis turris, Strain CCMP 815" /LENGTH=113 /DNA_ID=CAMNT_0040652497 /DNA_START=167 /DNA_END=504 /DNA_ORIENTATION=-